MKFTQDSPIWTLIKNAYTNNDQPIIFALINIIFIIFLGIAIYGIIKWKKDYKRNHFTTIVASVISALFIIFAVIYLLNPNNHLGNYEGTVDIAFTSSVDSSDNKVAILSDKDAEASEVDSFVMKASDMKELGIKAGKTVKIEANDKKAPNDNFSFIKLNKTDVADEQQSSKIEKYNSQQVTAEEAKKQKNKKEVEEVQESSKNEKYNAKQVKAKEAKKKQEEKEKQKEKDKEKDKKDKKD